MKQIAQLKRLIILASLFVVPIVATASCSSFLYSKEMDVAKKMASGGVYLVTESSLEQIGRGGPVTTGACDLSITVKPASGGEQAALCVYKDHTAFTDYAALKSGDKLRFRYVEDVMQKGGSGPREVSFLLFDRVYR